MRFRFTRKKDINLKQTRLMLYVLSFTLLKRLPDSEAESDFVWALLLLDATSPVTSWECNWNTSTRLRLKVFSLITAGFFVGGAWPLAVYCWHISFYQWECGAFPLCGLELFRRSGIRGVYFPLGLEHVCMWRLSGCCSVGSSFLALLCGKCFGFVAFVWMRPWPWYVL